MGVESRYIHEVEYYAVFYRKVTGYNGGSWVERSRGVTYGFQKTTVVGVGSGHDASRASAWDRGRGQGELAQVGGTRIPFLRLRVLAGAGALGQHRPPKRVVTCLSGL